MIISLINIYVKMADERQSDLSVVYGVCPQNRKQSYKLKILYNLSRQGLKVKMTSKSDFSWSAISSIIINSLFE